MVFDALGNPLRRQIIQLLATQAYPVSQIAKQFPVSRPAISKHLRLLEQAGLITHQVNGNQNFYHLQAQGFQQAQAWLDNYWDQALNRFRLLAENTQPQN
uniref:Transcriptional regulator n=1 Tax=OCS116 cluster bacterium TaxID=2030921 RepID=A0A2A4Z5A1_9PROT